MEEVPNTIVLLETELNDLSDKLNKLDAFYLTEDFKALPANEQEIIFVQRCAMINYHFALRCRIFNESQKVAQ